VDTPPPLLFSIFYWPLFPTDEIWSLQGESSAIVGAEYFFTGKLRKSIGKQDIAVLEIYREKSEA